MPHDLFCPECGGPLNEASRFENHKCRLCNAEVAVQALDESFDEDDAPSCPACNGPGVLLGKLGKLNHYRCRNCGMVFSVEEG